MGPGTRLESLAAVADFSNDASAFGHAFRDFLDGFYADPAAEKLGAEPRRLQGILHDDGYADAFLAALAEHLAFQFRLPVPVWCQDLSRTLAEPRFSFDTPEGRMFLLVESPTSFRSRNLFVSAEALTRV